MESTSHAVTGVPAAIPPSPPRAFLVEADFSRATRGLFVSPSKPQTNYGALRGEPMLRKRTHYCPLDPPFLACQQSPYACSLQPQKGTLR
jgi:hypothetical protein